jgi:hypothetical protein
MESTTILRYEHVQGLGVIDMWDLGYVEGIDVLGQITICNLIKTGEDLGVERARGFHDVGMLDVSKFRTDCTKSSHQNHSWFGY